MNYKFKKEKKFFESVESPIQLIKDKLVILDNNILDKICGALMIERFTTYKSMMVVEDEIFELLARSIIRLYNDDKTDKDIIDLHISISGYDNFNKFWNSHEASQFNGTNSYTIYWRHITQYSLLLKIYGFTDYLYNIPYIAHACLSSNFIIMIYISYKLELYGTIKNILKCFNSKAIFNRTNTFCEIGKQMKDKGQAYFDDPQDDAKNIATLAKSLYFCSPKYKDDWIKNYKKYNKEINQRKISKSYDNVICI